jgi:hypothetical protein
VTSALTPRPDSGDRERAIVRFLKDAGADGAGIKELYETVGEEIGDSVTRQAYYKVLDRLIAAGKVEVLRDDTERGRMFGLTPTLHAANALTLDDVYEMLPYIKTTDALARVVDAQDYYEEHRPDVIRRAAEALLQEDAVDLFARFLLERVDLVRRDLEVVQHQNEAGEAELADRSAFERLETDYADLDSMAYRALSLPRDAIGLPARLHLKDPKAVMKCKVECDEKKLREALKRRVFGGAFLREIDIADLKPQRPELVVSGSDGSMHAGTLGLQTASGFVEDIASDVITFNNSIAYVKLAPKQAGRGRLGEAVYSAPFTRQTIDDPNYRGMVLAPFMYPDLSEAEYEHMAKSATDVVQFRVDAEVIGGTAYDIRPPNSQIPRPSVHIRDGTITPQEREWNHYTRSDRYGEMVREGIRHERLILEKVIAAGDRAPLFAGAVKATQMRIFSRLLNWYIARGSAARFNGKAIEPNWDVSRAAGIADNTAMTAVFASLPKPGAGKHYVSCALLRQFPALTEFYNVTRAPGDTWLDYFQKKKELDRGTAEREGGTPRYHLTTDLSDDDFVFMCDRADFVSFYIGHTGAEPPPTIPRYEFLASLRAETDGADNVDEARRRVDAGVKRMVNAVDAAGLSIDRDHNFLTGKMLVKLIPFPIWQAHEHAKTLGKKLEAELKSIVVLRLIELKRLRADTKNLVLRPVAVRRYLERFARAQDVRKRNGTDQEPR